MTILTRFGDWCWEGLTLKHVEHKKIRLPYILFMILATLFEVFLLALMMISLFFFEEFDYNPNGTFFISITIVIALLFITVSSLVAILKKR